MPSVFVGIDPGVPLTMGVLGPEGPRDVYEGEGVAVQVQKPRRKSLAWENNPTLISAALCGLRDMAELRGEKLSVVVERVSMRPEQDMRSGQEFVGSMYMIMGICAALHIPLLRVVPSVWKPALGIKVTLKNPKEPARQRALEMWPRHADLFRRKLDHNRAEALLLAHYAATRAD